MKLQHYIKVAFRNLKKYKLQSMVSILGLAIGFACFTLSVLWIRYELTFDTFHQDAERIYLVQTESHMSDNGISYITPYPLAGYLKETFPEIKQTCNMQAWETGYKFKGEDMQSFQIALDSSTVNMFNIRTLSGNNHYRTAGNNEIAISDQLARKLFGAKNPLGEEIELQGEKRLIGAVVSSWGKHSNLPFDILHANASDTEWNISALQTFIKIKPGIDTERFRKKLHTHVINNNNIAFTNFILTPITTLRYEHPINASMVKFEHIRLFAVAGGLVILCSLFNYLTLFINRIRIRSKEIGLRKVSGSSNTDLMALFSIEYFLTLCIALLCGMVLIEIVLPYFQEVSGITTTISKIYTEVLIYATGVILLSFIISGILVYSFRKQTIQTILKGGKSGKGKNIFSRVSLTAQLVISIGFIFCSSVLIKQIHHLNTVNLGFERANRASISVYPPLDGLREELAQQPFITEIFPEQSMALFPNFNRTWTSFSEWDNKPASIKSITLSTRYCNRAYFDFYKFRLIKGELPADNTPGQIVINETAAKEMGVDNPIRKTFKKEKNTLLITGIIQDFYISPPTVAPQPGMLNFSPNENSSNEILFKFQGDWKQCRETLEKKVKQMNPNITYTNIWGIEEEYQKFWKSESMLLKMLDFVTLICVLISLFGVFSQVTLDCELYRKEIAVRKINGASVSSIIQMFFQRYLELLCLASVIAFPVGYFIMKSWIENYVLQTTINWWFYPAIWLGIILILTLCTLWRIQKAANQNPAEVIKSE